MRYECLKSNECFENFQKSGKKWLINVNEEPDMINTTLDNRRNLRHLGVLFGSPGSSKI